MGNGGYWVAPIYLLREFIKTYNVVQLGPFGHEFLRVLGATPLGPAIDSLKPSEPSSSRSISCAQGFVPSWTRSGPSLGSESAKHFSFLFNAYDVYLMHIN